MQLLGAESIQKQKNNFLVGTKSGWRQAIEGAVGGASAPGADDGGHQIDETASLIIGPGKVAEAEGGGHREGAYRHGRGKAIPEAMEIVGKTFYKKLAKGSSAGVAFYKMCGP